MACYETLARFRPACPLCAYPFSAGFIHHQTSDLTHLLSLPNSEASSFLSSKSNIATSHSKVVSIFDTTIFNFQTKIRPPQQPTPKMER